ncbi:hypothetical protein DFH09DRAFT_1206999 [Mycena vulgaris]|nr:hypothetical protein DFH09DRAFT_1206999 [Mycena vulgaris]
MTRISAGVSLIAMITLRIRCRTLSGEIGFTKCTFATSDNGVAKTKVPLATNFWRESISRNVCVEIYWNSTV